MPGAARRLRTRLGRRGTILTLNGAIATLYGAGLIVAPPPDRRSLYLLLMLAPLPVWAWAWITAGVAALGYAWAGPSRDWPGFTAVWAISAAWATGLLLAWWPLGESPRGWITACMFGAFGAVCLVVIGWEESPGRARSDGGRRES